ncbi:MAG TPA: excinuclease ABC subunit UvrC [Spirochaetia bacterium]|nr:excinuclease ABC subunit UvrC [Spirochaetales bacterium]HQK34300.1 excinuclease ABC subunit UvrC [Spirochaetales bacterium]HRS64405.1 excinuclease ABC subunit UvrC [Spirochaetia bacterium]
MDSIETLKRIALSAPQSPGVYLWKDNEGTILYIGKAVSLKNRLLSYFSSKSPYKVRFILKHATTIEWIQTENEYDALLLENNLIKQYAPRYNVNLKDGKTYPSIKITNEPYPRIFRTRTIIKDGGQYYGPFPSADIIDRYISIIKKLFPLRYCKVMRKRETPCLYYHIGKCSAPCARKITQEAYMHFIEQAKLLLEGKTETLIKNLTQTMHELSQAMQYEKAAQYRDIIISLETFKSENPVMDFSEDNHDVIAWKKDHALLTIIVFQFRNGKMINRDLFRETYAGPEEEAIQEFIISYYNASKTIPAFIIMKSITGQELLEQYFMQQHKISVSIKAPKTSREESSRALAEFNAAEDIRHRRKETGFFEGMNALLASLSLPKLPETIICMDIAQLGGTHTVASVVQFVNGVPDKKSYRLYTIRSLNGAIDDYEAIREATARHFMKLINQEEGIFPDLIVIDGGIGQVHAAQEILSSLNLHIPLIGLAKEKETIIMQDSSELQLELTNPGLQLLVALRDEAHRFATKTNQIKRKQAVLNSIFSEVQGIGPKKTAYLLKELKTLEHVAEADSTYLEKLLHINREQAEAIKELAQKHVQKQTHTSNNNENQ